MECIDNLKTPPVYNKLYLVPCALLHNRIGEFDEDMYLKSYYIPIVNHLHSDKESGQDYKHYHIDYRFISKKEKKRIFKSNLGIETRINLNEVNPKIIYVIRRCINQEQSNITPKIGVRINTLKHKCIYKGKCPHKGYELSQVIPREGKITCPLHGLEFDENTLKLII